MRFTGRGTDLAPPNRFETVRHERDWEQLAADDELLADKRRLPTTFLPDKARTLIRENDSPDVGFRFSVNPYRGCFHSCSYCYARSSHEYLGFGAGTDFDRKIVVKTNTPQLLRDELERKSWKGDCIAFSAHGMASACWCRRA